MQTIQWFSWLHMVICNSNSMLLLITNTKLLTHYISCSVKNPQKYGTLVSVRLWSNSKFTDIGMIINWCGLTLVEYRNPGTCTGMFFVCTHWTGTCECRKDTHLKPLSFMNSFHSGVLLSIIVGGISSCLVRLTKQWLYVMLNIYS